MRRKEHFVVEMIARRPTLCDAIVVKLLNQARNRAHAPPQILEEYGSAVSSQASELCPLKVSVAGGDGIVIDSTHGGGVLNHLTLAIYLCLYKFAV